MYYKEMLIIYWGLLCPAAAEVSSVPNLDLEAKKDGPSALTSSEALLCPSINVQWVKYKCPGPFSTWNDCSRPHCCPGFAPSCCNTSVWPGYRFNAAQNHGDRTLTCEDVDECAENLHNCEQICQNTPGSFVCACEHGFDLRADNRTCSRVHRHDDKCLTSCDTVSRLQEKIYNIVEKLTALETAVSMSLQRSSSSRPAEESPVVMDGVDTASAGYFGDFDGKTYSILDTFVQTGAGYCKCQRGPIGPPGPTGAAGLKGSVGERGPRGPKGSGNFDFMALMIADLRHDVVQLQKRVFQGEKLPQFDLNSIPRSETKTLTEDFSASKTTHISDYATVGPAESSGDEWDQYE